MKTLLCIVAVLLVSLLGVLAQVSYTHPRRADVGGITLLDSAIPTEYWTNLGVNLEFPQQTYQYGGFGSATQISFTAMDRTNHFQVYQATWSSEAGGCMVLDGTDDRLTNGPAASLGSGLTYTVVAWMNPGSSTDFDTLIAHNTYGGGNFWSLNFQAEALRNPRRFYWENTTQTSLPYWDVYTNTWTCLVVVFCSNVGTSFLNGVVASWSATITRTDTASLVVGARLDNVSATAWNGKIGEFKIFTGVAWSMLDATNYHNKTCGRYGVPKL